MSGYRDSSWNGFCPPEPLTVQRFIRILKYQSTLCSISKTSAIGLPEGSKPRQWLSLLLHLQRWRSNFKSACCWWSTGNIPALCHTMIRCCSSIPTKLNHSIFLIVTFSPNHRLFLGAGVRYKIIFTQTFSTLQLFTLKFNQILNIELCHYC